MYSFVGKKISRIDGEEKATGALRYMTDYKFKDALVGRVLRAKYPHALIEKIDINDASALEGVHGILTAQDIPGLNGFGIECPDQPVLCDKKVRFLGDAVAFVVAETEQQAAQALAYIKVDYHPLEVIDEPEKAVQPGVPLIHEKGNLLRHNKAVAGDPETAFKRAYLVVERNYTTTWQEHAFIETEGGFAVPQGDGGVTIYCPAQYGYRDRQQLGKILNLPEEKIIVISSPMGGGFGGKDDLNVQALLALGALKTNRPVFIHLAREESFMTGIKRQPFHIKMRTAVSATGEFLAQEVDVLCDTGPYASLGGAIMSFGLENCCGSYYFPNVKLEGHCVYTNNLISGEFRGFGNNQMHFALESQVDIIAHELGIDPIEIRQKNCIKSGQRHSHGHRVAASVGAMKTLEAAKDAQLWKNRHAFKSQTTKPWMKRGVGIAMCQHANGLGKGLPDHSTASMEIREDGTFILAISSEEIGQGVMTTLAIIGAEVLGTEIRNIKIVNGDTSLAPDGGSCTASRTTYIAGNAVIKAARKMKELLIRAGAEILGIPADKVSFCSEKIRSESGQEVMLSDLVPLLQKQGKAKVVETAIMPETDITHDIGLHYIQGYLTQVVGVEVNTLTGKTDVIVTEVFPDAGKVINLLGYEGQVEGGTVMGMGYALMENYQTKQGKSLTRNLQTYLIPTASDMPEIRITPVEVLEESGPFGAKGFGETTSIAVTPAIMNAIYDAVGVRVFHLPADPETVYGLIKKKHDYSYKNQLK